MSTTFPTRDEAIAAAKAEVADCERELGREFSRERDGAFVIVLGLGGYFLTSEALFEFERGERVGFVDGSGFHPEA